MIITKRAVTKHNSFAQIWKFLNSVQINIQISPTHFEEKMLLIGNKSVEMIEHFISFRFAVIFIPDKLHGFKNKSANVSTRLSDRKIGIPQNMLLTCEYLAIRSFNALSSIRGYLLGRIRSMEQYYRFAPPFLPPRLYRSNFHTDKNTSPSCLFPR